jgi:hypothetical protein
VGVPTTPLYTNCNHHNVCNVTMSGPRTVDVAFWESFGKGWYSDTKSHLKLKCNAFKADYGL